MMKESLMAAKNSDDELNKELTEILKNLTGNFYRYGGLLDMSKVVLNLSLAKAVLTQSSQVTVSADDGSVSVVVSQLCENQERNSDEA